MKKTRKFLCILLVAVMLLGVMPMGAFAAGLDSSASSSSILDVFKGILDDEDATNDLVNAVTGLISGNGDIKTELLKVLNSDKAENLINQYLLGNLDKDTAAALDNILGGLDISDTSNISDALLKALDNDATKEAAMALITKLGGNLGGSELTDLLMQALEKGIDDGTVAELAGKLFNGGKISTEDLTALLTKLGQAGIESGALEALLKNLGVSDLPIDASTIEQLKALLGGDVSGIDTDALIAKLEQLLGTSSTDSSFLDKFKDAISGLGFSKVDISDLAGILAGLMGNGSEADIDDEDTPLAGLAALNTTDHIAYVQGVGGGKFAPGADMTRAEAAQMLYNLLTADSHAKCDTTVNSFSDVSASAWYNTAVSTLANAGAISGYTDGTFRPAKKITRAELVNMVVGLVGQVDGAKSTFPDVAAGSWYYASAATAQTKGWIQGADGKYLPTKNMSRAEAVTFINSVLERSCDLSYVKSHSVTSFSDVATGAWYYGAVMEAANGHDYAKSTSGAETWTGLK